MKTKVNLTKKELKDLELKQETKDEIIKSLYKIIKYDVKIIDNRQKCIDCLYKLDNCIDPKEEEKYIKLHKMLFKKMNSLCEKRNDELKIYNKLEVLNKNYSKKELYIRNYKIS